MGVCMCVCGFCNMRLSFRVDTVLLYALLSFGVVEGKVPELSWT